MRSVAHERLEFYLRDVTRGMRVSEEFQEVITVASKTEYSVHLVFRLCFHSGITMNVDKEELWLALFSKFASLERTRRIFCE